MSTLILPLTNNQSNTPYDNTYTYSYSIAHKLGSFAGRSVSALKSKRGKKLALQSYIITEAIISIVSIISLIIAGIYFPAILLTIMMAYLVYASFDVFS